MFYLRVFLAILGFLAASVCGVLLAVVRRDRSRVAYDYARMLMRWMRPPLGLEVRVVGREHLRERRPCIYLANHQSAFDVPVLAELYPPDTVIIGKQELRNIPLFGWIFRVTGNILIDRRNNPSAVERLREAEVAIRDRRVSVWIFPEGTRGKEPGRLLPFKKGAFYMAVSTGTPLVPVVVAPLQPVFDLRRRHLRSGTVEVRVLEPVPTHGLTEADVIPLLNAVRDRMQAALDELSARQGLAAGTRRSDSAPRLPSSEGR